MSSYNLTESALWQQETDKLVGELHAGADKALAEAASRGFAAAPGDTLAAILAAGQAVKGKLVEANGKIYESRRKTLFEIQTFAMEMIVKLAKLGMQLYAAELIFALELENAANTALRDQGNADIIRMSAEVDLRQRAMIQSRAEAERRVVVLKAALVVAEEKTLPFETALVAAQIKTAEEKLRIIESIYLIIEAQELELAAENRRAATLEVLLAAQLVVAEIKKAMIPFYIEKADARLELADAITAEIPISKAIIELGYDRIDLENRKEFAAHLLRLAENELELAKLGWTRANSVLTFTQLQSRRLLQEYENVIQAEVLTLKKSLTEDGVDLRLTTSLARQAIGVNDDVQVTTAEVNNTRSELMAIIAGLEDRANAQADTIEASQDKRTMSHATNNIQRKIIAGSMGS
jgi:hypothetical protein